MVMATHAAGAALDDCAFKFEPLDTEALNELPQAAGKTSSPGESKPLRSCPVAAALSHTIQPSGGV